MKAFHFFKATGSGNDFIIADNRGGNMAREDQPALARKLCERKLNVGADGLVLIEDSDSADFVWRFYNSDGSEAEMCGNASRCVARVALRLGIAKEEMTFETLAGTISARVMEGRVKARLPDPTGVKLFYPLEVDGAAFNVSSINTGVPHVVLLVDNVDKADLERHGPMIRYHEAYAPAGTNVNFVEFEKGGGIRIRTYERGVEGETLACGTGSVAAALVRAAADATPSPIPVRVASGETLLIHFKRRGKTYSEVYLEGEAKILYEADLLEDALTQ